MLHLSHKFENFNDRITFHDLIDIEIDNNFEDIENTPDSVILKSLRNETTQQILLFN
jgi:hypothetical protein